jgi:hypothetical protein
VYPKIETFPDNFRPIGIYILWLYTITSELWEAMLYHLADFYLSDLLEDMKGDDITSCMYNMLSGGTWEVQDRLRWHNLARTVLTLQIVLRVLSD